ncbi:protein YqbG [Listeria booriae]|uniref:DUF3199 family protein n=1 Tax=Listeria booriae TaxID=1552123 RepID=A0A842CQF2_9LIST|nr:DUF3199 family protein [Listeria booriae]MBC1209475.1 DUF3199 family protein [Listeria booriae]MBC1523567.1 DUF3199 family protein [Listeria booriae]MBC2004441.1 DUF3199 family protein [Listeria booriae]MBC2241819.1 DUF3199 family protein [Listeria booriae]MBC2369952.1 DUF3199 family protein [Listeria booriae]
MSYITPQELKSYSEFEAVKERSDDSLSLDIIEAESDLESTLRQPISEVLDVDEKLPEKLRIALLKLAQFFALINSDDSIQKGYTSEKMSDYSYTIGSGDSLKKPDISGLINGFINEDVQKLKKGLFRMRGI